jgi:hypothetical protein
MNDEGTGKRSDPQEDGRLQFWLSVGMLVMVVAMASVLGPALRGFFTLPGCAKLFLASLPMCGFAFGAGLFYGWCQRRFGWVVSLFVTALVFLAGVAISLAIPLGWAANPPTLSADKVRDLAGDTMIFGFIFGMLAREQSAIAQWAISRPKKP